VIEGDSTIIINAIRQGRTPNWKLNSAIEQIMESLEVIGDYTVNHIYREGNTDADKLANLGADGQEIEEIHESLKEELGR
jgi:ribonuclease HI